MNIQSRLSPMNFKMPVAVIWAKVDGSITTGILTSNLDLVPTEAHPKSSHPKIRGYKRLFCLQRGRWVSLYTKSILASV